MNDLLVETRGLTRLFRLGKEEVRAVDGVDLAVKKGELVAIMGPSGSGKTTLLNLLGALDRPTSGKIYFGGQDLLEMSEGELDRFRLRRLGFIFQRFNLLPTLTALENVMLPLGIAGASREEQQKRGQELMGWVGLGGRLQHRPGELSAGESQRVGLARALANKPSLLLADEPTGNLDSRTGREILSLLEKVRRELETTVIVVTHNPEVAPLATRVFHMRDGRLSPAPP